MIRVGPSSVLSSNLNDFHQTSPQASGFYSNTTSSVAPGTDYFQYLGFDFPIPPYPTTFKDKTLAVYRYVGVPQVPTTISSVYLEIKRVSGGFQVARFANYSSVIEYNSPVGSFSYGHGLLTDDLTYLRLGSLLPVPTDFVWLSSASGTSPRLIIAYQSAVVRVNGTFETSQVGGSLRVAKLTYNSTDLVYDTLQVPFVFVTDLTLSNWSGSGLGGGTFLIWIITEAGVL